MNQSMQFQVGHSIELLIARRALESICVRVDFGHVIAHYVNIGKQTFANGAAVLLLFRFRFDRMQSIYVDFERSHREYVAFVTNVALVNGHIASYGRWLLLGGIALSILRVVSILPVAHKRLCTVLAFVNPKMIVDMLVPLDASRKVFAANVAFVFVALEHLLNL